ncbi:hypothetical protein K7432_014268, partial [Basidiobolus ranarum]
LGYYLVSWVIIVKSIRLLFIYNLSAAKLATALNVSSTSTWPKSNDQQKSCTLNQSEIEMLSISGMASNPTFHKSYDLETNWYYRHQYLVTSNALYKIMFAVLFVHLVVLIVQQSLGYNVSLSFGTTTDKCFDSWEWISFQVSMALYSFVFIFLLVKSRTIDDAYGLRWELIVVTIETLIFNIIFIVYFSISHISLSREVAVSIGAFVFSSICYFFMAIKPALQAYGFLQTSSYSIKIRPRALKLDYESFELVLNNPDLFSQFKTFAVKDFTVENVLCYEQYHKLHNISEETGYLNENLIEFFETFVHVNSRFMVNITSSTRHEIENLIQKQACHIHMYDSLYLEVKDLMFRNTFPRFLMTDENSSNSLYP